MRTVAALLRLTVAAAATTSIASPGTVLQPTTDVPNDVQLQGSPNSTISSRQRCKQLHDSYAPSPQPWPTMESRVLTDRLLDLSTCRNEQSGIEVPQCGSISPLRLVINSDTSYKLQTARLIESLVRAGFKDWEHVILVSGNEPDERPPTLEPVQALLRNQSAMLHGAGKVVVIRTAWRNFDYHGYACLFKYRKHHLVRASAYFYLLCTSLVLPTFCSHLSTFTKLDWSGSQYHSVRLPASNTGLLSHDVVESYGHNFDEQVTKHQAIYLEFQLAINSSQHCNASDVAKCPTAEDPTEKCPTSGPGKMVYPITHFAAHVYFYGDRYASSYAQEPDTHDVDFYHDGKKRRAYWYPAFALVKLLGAGSGIECPIGETDAVLHSRNHFWEELIDGLMEQFNPNSPQQRMTLVCNGSCGVEGPPPVSDPPSSEGISGWVWAACGAGGGLAVGAALGIWIKVRSSA